MSQIRGSEGLSFLRFVYEIELSLQSCALSVDDFPRSRPRNRENRDANYFGDIWRLRKPFYQKNKTFAPLTLELTHSRAVTLPNYLMMGGSHDDVVDMMMRILTMTMVRNGEVF